MVSTLKKISQIAFMLIFFAMVIMGRIQLWMAIFVISTVITLLLGRFYCGWICPINTLTEGINWIYKKLHLKRKPVPQWIKNPFISNGILLLFLGIMIFVLKTGRKLPVLPALVLMGTAITLVFEPAFWHTYLCPYGKILSFTGRFSKHHWTVDNESCIKCGICKKVCPAEAVKMDSRDVYPLIDKKICLSCMACAEACPKDAIKYI